MAKRMIDTEIWSQRWFCDLSTDAKMLYFYFFGNCNHAGILDLWDKRFKDDTGLSLSKCISEMSGIIVEYKNGSYFMPRFISDQYPDFPNSKVRAQDSAIKILEKELLMDLVLNPLERVSKPLVKGYGYEHDNGYDIGSGIGSSNDNSNKAKNGKKSIRKKPEKMTDDEFGRMMLAKGFKCYGEFENVFLTDAELDRGSKKYGTMVMKEAIDQLSAWKQDKGLPLCEHVSDLAKMHNWVFQKVIDILTKRGVNYKDAHARELGLNKAQ